MLESKLRAARMTTRLQMELGGKNPLIVMEDADLDHAANLVVQGGFGLSDKRVLEPVAYWFTKM